MILRQISLTKPGLCQRRGPLETSEVLLLSILDLLRLRKSLAEFLNAPPGQRAL